MNNHLIVYVLHFLICCLGYIEDSRVGNGPRPRGRNFGGRAAKRQQTRLNIAMYQEHPERINDIKDENEKQLYIKYLSERKERLKWLSSVTSVRRSFFMHLVFVLMIVIYIWEIIFNKNFDFTISHPWLWGSVSPDTLLDCGAKYTPLIVNGEFWRLITPLFVHVSLIHILINVVSQKRFYFYFYLL